MVVSPSVWLWVGRAIGLRQSGSFGKWLRTFRTMFGVRRTWAGFSSAKAGLLKQSLL
jgi:hypothetical protein